MYDIYHFLSAIKAYARRNRNKRPTLDDGEFMTLKNNLCNNTAPQIIHHHDRNIEAQLSAEQNIGRARTFISTSD